MSADTNFRFLEENIFNLVSQGNSTDVPLAAGDSFTGVSEVVTKFNAITVSVKTDQDGEYSVQFSGDNTNWDTVTTINYQSSQIEATHRFVVTLKYVRVIFTNTSGVNQTYLRLNTVYGTKDNLNTTADSTLPKNFDAVVVRPTNYSYEIALGRRQGATTWNVWGINSDVDIGTEVVAAQGGMFTFLTSASTLTIVSSNASDDGSPAGTGANSVTIEGIDANRMRQVEVVVLNGVTPVVTTTSWLGINKTFVSEAGSALNNVGNITMTATTGGTIQSYIQAGKGVSQQIIFFTQANHQLLMDWILVSAEKLGSGNPKVQFRGWVWSAVTNSKHEIFYLLVDVSVETDHLLNISQPLVIDEKSVEATTDTNNSIVVGRFSAIEFMDAV